jgi:hypothetical protein
MLHCVSIANETCTLRPTDQLSDTMKNHHIHIPRYNHHTMQ